MDNPIASRLAAHIRVDPATQCWNWTGCISHGYGVLKLGGRAGAVRRVHRLSWEVHRGSIPSGLCVLHTCDNRACINPDHLWLGTYRDNNQDAWRKGRNARGTRHGHAKLTLSQVIQIYRSPQSQSKLAKLFGVNPSTVSRIKHKERWKESLQNAQT